MTSKLGLAVFHGAGSISRGWLYFTGKYLKLHALFHGIFKAFTRSFSRNLLDYTAISQRNKTKMVTQIDNFSALKYENNVCSKFSSFEDRLSSDRTYGLVQLQQIVDKHI